MAKTCEYVNKCSHSQPEDKRSEGSNEERKQAKHIRLCTHAHIRRHIHTLSHWQTNVYSTNFICWTNKSNNGDSNRATTISAAGQRQINVPSEKKSLRGEGTYWGREEWSVREADANMAGHKTHTTCATRRRRQIPANAWKRGTSFTPRLRPLSVPTI